MRIGIDARFWDEAGVGRYIRNLIAELSKIDSQNEYVIFFLKKNLGQNLPKNFQEVETNFKWYGLAEQLKFPRVLRSHKLDLVHFPHFNTPVFYKGRFVVTIHDLIHQRFAMKRSTTHGGLIYAIKQLGYRFGFASSLKKSKKIITISDYVKNDLVRYWQVPDDKIIITKEAAEEGIIQLAKKMDQSQIKKVLNKFNVQPPFIYYIGNAHPHKNVEGLIKAFLILRKRYQYLQLVLSGHDHYFWQRVKDEFREKNIIYTGYVSDEEAVAFRKSAQVYVQPSFEEGFGIPLLEAFACQVPVVSSNAGSLPEVGADAALYFDPKDTNDMVEKLAMVLNSHKLARELVEKGLKRYRQFSWKKLAEETLKVYQESVD